MNKSSASLSLVCICFSKKTKQNKSSASAPPHSLKLEVKPKWWKNKQFYCVMSNLSKSPTTLLCIYNQLNEIPCISVPFKELYWFVPTNEGILAVISWLVKGKKMHYSPENTSLRAGSCLLWDMYSAVLPS